MPLPLRVYVDTCVLGGAFDEEFEEATNQFFAEAELGRFTVVLSALTRQEVERAPVRVKELFHGLLDTCDFSDTTEEAIALAFDYIDSGVVTRKHFEDALHVAIATVSGCDAIVSWNFKEIVHFEKIPAYEKVNKARGLKSPRIHSPPEMLHYEEDI